MHEETFLIVVTLRKRVSFTWASLILHDFSSQSEDQFLLFKVLWKRVRFHNIINSLPAHRAFNSLHLLSSRTSPFLNASEAKFMRAIVYKSNLSSGFQDEFITDITLDIFLKSSDCLEISLFLHMFERAVFLSTN